MRGRGKTPFQRTRKAQTRTTLPKAPTGSSLISAWWQFVQKTPYDIQHDHLYGATEKENAGVRNKWPDYVPYKVLQNIANLDLTTLPIYKDPAFTVQY